MRSRRKSRHLGIDHPEEAGRDRSELLYGLLVKVLASCHREIKSCPGVIYIADPEHSGIAETLIREARVKGVLVKPLGIERIVSTVKKVTALNELNVDKGVAE